MELAPLVAVLAYEIWGARPLGEDVGSEGAMGDGSLSVGSRDKAPVRNPGTKASRN